MLILPRTVHDQMVAHCLVGLPDEACGLLGGDPATGEVADLLPDPEPGRLGQALHRRPEGAPAGRPGRRGRRARHHRGLPLPHPHRGLPVAHRRGPGPGPGLALRAGLAAGHPAGGAELPDRRRGRSRRSRSVCWPVESDPKVTFDVRSDAPATGRHPSQPAPRAGTQGAPVPVQVNLPTVLRPHAGGQRTVAVDGATVGEVLTPWWPVPGHVRPGHRRRRVAPQVRERLPQRRRRPVPVGLDTPVGDGDELSILPAVAGGASAPGHRAADDRLRLGPRPDRQHARWSTSRRSARTPTSGS